MKMEFQNAELPLKLKYQHDKKSWSTFIWHMEISLKKKMHKLGLKLKKTIVHLAFSPSSK